MMRLPFTAQRSIEAIPEAGLAIVFYEEFEVLG
jgi:hypothetical protein